MIAGSGAVRAARLDELLVNDPVLKRTGIAWLRDWAEAPTASNLMAMPRPVGVLAALVIAINRRNNLSHRFIIVTVA